MKVQQEVNNNIEYIGEIRENKVGIDRANIDFIATLLTSNLYSNPFESFLRETVSNAYDSHIEAKTNHPIILMIESNEKYNSYIDSDYNKESYNVSIRDYGVGISPERFQKIYTNIGSSTKRESNDYIGGWGIGRFAALSCSDNVQINSYYNGVKYSYIMYKNGTGINIDKVSETKGDYKQGVEICVNNILLTVDTIIDAIGKLIFFENLVIHDNNVQNRRLKFRIDDFNKRKIEHFENFSACDFEYIDNGVYAKVGKVLYKTQAKSHPIFGGFNFIAVECPIGSVNVTPNREQLQYTDKTNKKLNEIYDAAFEEMTQKVMKTASKNFKSVQEAFIFYTESRYLKIASRISFNAQQILKFEDLTVNNQKIPSYIWQIIQKIGYEDIPELIICDVLNKGGKRYTKKWITYTKLLSSNLAIKCDDRLKNITKSYYCDVVNENLTYVIKESDIKNLLKDVIFRSCRHNTISEVTALRAISFMLKNFKYYKLENNKVPESYIKEYKDTHTSKSNRKLNEIVEVRSYNLGAYRIMNHTTYINYYVYENGLSKKKKLNNTHLVVYAPNTKDDRLIRDLAESFRKYCVRFITLKKEHLSVIPKNKLFMSLENFLTLQNKIITKAATARYLSEKYRQYYNMITKYPAKLKEEFSRYLLDYGITSGNDDTIKLLDQYIEKKWLDWAAVIKFSLNEKDIKRICQRNIICNLDNIADSLLYVINGKYINDDKFGITPDKKTTLLIKKLLNL